MESGSFRGLEFLVIVGVVAWFYFAQTHNLRRLKEELKAKEQPIKAAKPLTEADAPTDTGK